jgi:hypothetical protein
MKREDTTNRLTLLLLTLLFAAIVGSGRAQMSWDAQMAQYDQAMDAWVQQQMQQAQQGADQAYNDILRFFIDYYRQNTGDYVTPDAQAVALGDRLYCQHYPAQCQQNNQNAQAWSQIGAAGHAQNMADIQSWGQNALAIGQSDSSILDMNHEGFLGNQAMQDAGQANLVQGAIHGESTFVNPTSGASFSLPVYPDPNLSYYTPEGYPLVFDYQSNLWYQGDSSGWWYPLSTVR